MPPRKADSDILDQLKEIDDKMENLENAIYKLTNSINSLNSEIKGTVNILKNSVPVKIVVLIIFAVVVGKNSENLGNFILNFFK